MSAHEFTLVEHLCYLETLIWHTTTEVGIHSYMPCMSTYTYHGSIDIIALYIAILNIYDKSDFDHSTTAMFIVSLNMMSTVKFFCLLRLVVFTGSVINDCFLSSDTRGILACFLWFCLDNFCFM